MDEANTLNKRIVRLRDVRIMTGKSRSSIYAEITDGRFPKQVKIGKRAVGWDCAAIQSYIRDKLNGRD